MKIRHPKKTLSVARPVPNSRWMSIAFIITLLGAFICWTNSAHAVIYVDADRPGGDGSSWENAYATLEDALFENGENEEFWVAGGTYTPVAVVANRPDSGLVPKSGAAIYGGFAGNEAQRDQRDVASNPTIIDGQDALNHLIFIESGAANVRIDGLEFIRGRADSGSGWDPYGGAMFIQRQNPVIVNCSFKQNSSVLMGGAIYADYGDVDIENCYFQGNSSNLGGAVAGYSSTLTISGSEFDANLANVEAQSRGGAIWVSLQGARIQGCLFTNNEANWNGGAIELNNTPGSVVSGSTFSNNTAGQTGGGIFVDQESCSIQDSTFTGNSADVMGGGGYLNTTVDTVIDGCDFSSNSSSSGGALGVYDSGVTISDTRFDSNYAGPSTTSSRGGAIWLHLQNPEIRDCEFSNNEAAHLGGAVELNNTPDALVSGCDFTDNTAGNGGGGLTLMWNETSPAPSTMVYDCLFEGNTSGLEGGGVYSYSHQVDFTNSRFKGNTGVNGGAIMLDYKDAALSRVSGCLFVANTATEVGGAIRTFARSIDVENSVFAHNSAPNAGGIGAHAGTPEFFDPNFTAIIKNSTFYGNRAEKASDPDNEGFGGAILNTNVSMMYLYNCIFWENVGEKTIWDAALGEHVATPDVFNAGSSSMETRYTDMQSLDWYHGSIDESHVGSFSSDPLFEDPDGVDDVDGTLDDNFRLTMSSPCLDRADGDYAPTTDIDSNPRIDLPSVEPNPGTGSPDYADVGAYELGEPPTATTSPASSIIGYSAVLNGVVDSMGGNATVKFEYGATTSYGSEITADQSPFTTAGDTAVTASLAGLSLPEYHFRVVAENGWGVVYGEDRTFSLNFVFVEAVQTGGCGGNLPCYTTIDDAIVNADSGAVIRIGEGSHGEDIVVDRDVSIILEGGWDAAFSTQSSGITSSRSLTLGDGTVNVEKLVLRP